MRRAVLTTNVVTTAGALLLVIWTGWGSPSLWALPLLTVAIAGSESTAVRLVIGRQGLSFTLNEAFIAVGLVLAPGAWTAVAVVLGFYLAHARSLPRQKLVFNLASYGFAFAAGAALTVALNGGIVAAAAGLAVSYLLTHLLVGIAVAASSRERYHRVLLATAWLGAFNSAGNISVGLLAGWLAVHAPLGLLGLVVPLALLWWSYDQQARRSTEARLFEELVHRQEKVTGRSIDTSAQVIVTAAARLFGGAEIEMLLRHPDGPVHYSGDEHGLQSRARVEADVFGTPWVLRTLAARGVLTGVEDDRPFCSALLGDRERPLALLIARRPERSGAFTRSDQRLIEILVAQAESWLSVADLTARHDAAVGQVEAYGAASRVLGDIGVGTAPALVVLRESANRLSRLAYAFDGPDPVSEIIDELHAVERAVASLLGAIALASDAQLAGDGGVDATGAFTSPRAEAEWTTTGRLEPVESR